MKTLKEVSKSWISLLLILLFSTALSAQRPQGPPPIPEGKEIVKMVNQLDKEIEMTDEQEAKVLKLYQEHFEEVKEIMEKGRPDRNEMDATMTAFEKKVKAELSKEQQAKYDAFQKKNSPQQGGRGQGLQR